jgi:hypothetical protein
MQNYLDTIEEEFKFFIENLLIIKGITVNFKTNQIEKLINFLTEKKSQKILDNFREDKVDFQTYINIILLLFSKDDGIFHSETTQFERKFIHTTGIELKHFRNLIQHSKNPLNSELTQRFFQDVYFFFRNIAAPIGKDIFSNFLKKDIAFNIKMLMSMNVNKDYSFDLAAMPEGEIVKQPDIVIDTDLFKSFVDEKDKLLEFKLEIVEQNPVDIRHYYDVKDISLTMVNNTYNLSKVSEEEMSNRLMNILSLTSQLSESKINKNSQIMDSKIVGTVIKNISGGNSQIVDTSKVQLNAKNNLTTSTSQIVNSGIETCKKVSSHSHIVVSNNENNLKPVKDLTANSQIDNSLKDESQSYINSSKQSETISPERKEQ